MNKVEALNYGMKVSRDLLDVCAAIRKTSIDTGIPDELEEELDALAQEAFDFVASLPDSILRESILFPMWDNDVTFYDDMPF